MKHLYMNQRGSRGFTIIELLVIAPVVILTIGAFITVIVNMTGEVLATRSANALAYDIQDTLSRIEEDVKLSSTFLAESNITGSKFSAPQGFNNDTTTFKNVDLTGSNGNMLILNVLATTDNPLFATSGLIYLANQPNACASTLFNQNNPMAMNVVYFLKTDPTSQVSSLWRRTIAPSDYTTAGCTTPWQQPSCNPTYMTQNPGSSTFCRTEDSKLLDYVGPSDFTVEYFSSADATTANTVAVTDPDIADRNNALQGLATVGVKINVSKTAGGREISQSSAIRATRVDTNASAIAPVPVSTTPTVPVVSTSINNPTSVVVTWPAVSGAESYTVDYNVNGGAWTNGFTGQALTSYTVPAVAHTNTVNVRVRATNTAGTSGYGTSSITIPRWTNFVLQNNWIDYSTSNWATAAYTKTSSGMVVLKGLIKSGTAGTTVATLPPGYRPSQNLLFYSMAASANARIDVYTNGNVNITTGSTDLSLESVRFMPAGTTFTNAAPPFYNGWTTYGDSNYGIIPQYHQNSSGRINLRAMISSGTITNDTPMFYMPAALRPALYAHLPANTCGGYGMYGINTSSLGSVVAKGSSNCWHSIHTNYYPSSRASGGTYGGNTCTTQWCTLPVTSGWVYYGSPFSTVEYTKDSDGMVGLKGFIRSGTASYDTILATLPTEYRPAQRLLIPTISNGAIARVDILPDGTVRFGIGSNAWFSLDNIMFMADGS